MIIGGGMRGSAGCRRCRTSGEEKEVARREAASRGWPIPLISTPSFALGLGVR